MLIKSITHTSSRASIQQLIDYVFGDKNMVSDKGESVCITRLLRGKRDTWANQFKRVEKRRTSFYAGKEIHLYHEILSFSPQSKPSNVELEDLIEKYLDLRLTSPTFAFSAVHFSPSHYHAHLVLQGIDCYGKSIRKEKKSFREQVQIALNEYQQHRYPHLSDSIIDYSTPSKEVSKRESHKSWQRNKRTGEQSIKKQISLIIENIFIQADSLETFVSGLSENDIICYYRRSVLTGVMYRGKKYRLKKTLGVDFEKLLAPNLISARTKRLEEIRERNRQQEKDKER